LALALNAQGANKAKLNGQSVGVGELLGWLRVVLFTPEDLSIVRGEPAVRRKFVDEAVAQLIPRMHSVFSEFDRLLKQRNALLKSARGMNRDAVIHNLESWNDAFVDLASDITLARIEVLALITPHIANAYNIIAPGHFVAVSLESREDMPADRDGLREYYRDELARRQRDEIDRGMTLVGPHRDDVAITLNGLPSRTHSSHGEAWSLALSLRLGVAQCYRDESTSGDPVMILDDVFAELDATRRLTLQRIVSDYEQVLVTAAVREDIPEGFSTQWFHVEAGVVTDVESLPSAP
jgi:DNA replication and repair protein RecF